MSRDELLWLYDMAQTVSPSEAVDQLLPDPWIAKKTSV
jgi:hypothetical protein